MRKESANRARDAAISRNAANQHGVVTAAQLRAAGLLPSRVADRLAAGRLHRVHRGVYAVGHANISNEGRWMAAVLAVGEGAVLSHRSAAALWRILPSAEVTEVTISGNAGRKRRPGMRIHRSRTLSSADLTRRAGIPVTKPARTLTDLRRVLPAEQYAAALRQAEYLRLPLGESVTPDHTRSELESRFLGLVRRHRLPRPDVNVRVDRFVVDFLWRPQGLVVELDGWRSHGTPSAFETDRARDTRLKLLGYEVLRFTWRQVDDRPNEVARAVRTLLRP